MLTNALPVIVVSIVMVLLFKASKKNPKIDNEGNFILKLPKLYSVIGLLGIIIAVALFIYDIFFANAEDKMTIFLIGLFFLLLGLPLFAQGSISHIKLTNFAIIETSMLGKTKEIKWDEIKDVSFGKVSLELKIKSSDKSIKAHAHLIGFENLVLLLEEKLGKNRQEFGIPTNVMNDQHKLRKNNLYRN